MLQPKLPDGGETGNESEARFLPTVDVQVTVEIGTVEYEYEVTTWVGELDVADETPANITARISIVAVYIAARIRIPNIPHRVNYIRFCIKTQTISKLFLFLARNFRRS